MVEDNTNTGTPNAENPAVPDDADEKPVKKIKLFGGRKSTKKVSKTTTEENEVVVDPTSVTPAADSRAADSRAAGERVVATSDAVAVGTATADAGVDSPAPAIFDPEHPGLAPLDPTALPEPGADQAVVVRSTTSLIFQAPDIQPLPPRPYSERDNDRNFDRERNFDRGRDRDFDDQGGEPTVRRRSRRRSGEDNRPGENDPANTVVKVRAPRPEPELITEPQRVKGSTRLEAKKQRRRDGRDAGRRRPVITEAEFLARRESVDRTMVVRAKDNKIQIGVLEDGVLVEHYVAKAQDASLIGNVYLGKVQNVLPSMEAAFVDIGRGRNAVLYSGEVDWDAAAAESTTNNQPRRIELALKPGATVLVQVTKDPVGHKGARLTSQVSLPGRYLVYVPNGSMNGISRKLPDTERSRLKKILKEVLPENVGVIVRTAAEGATEEQLTLDVNRLTAQWADISAQTQKQLAPALLHSEPDLLIKIVRDVFNEDFHRLVISGDEARTTIENYLRQVAPDLLDRVEKYEGERDAFDEFRISEQIEKALDRKVWLPSGGSLVIDRTEAMTVVDVNTGKFVGSGGNLEETVTKNNLEAAEEIVRQLRLRDIGGIIVVDFIDMVLETNRDLVLRRLIECLSRDRTKHQVAEVTSLGLVQMTRKKLGLGLLESFSEPCETCAGRGIIVHHDPVVKHRGGNNNGNTQQHGERRRNGRSNNQSNQPSAAPQTTPAPVAVGGGTHSITDDAKNALAQIAASTIHTATGSIAVISEQDAKAAASVAATDSNGAGSNGADSNGADSHGADSSAGQSAASASTAAGDNQAGDNQAGDNQAGGQRSRKGSRRARHGRQDAQAPAEQGVSDSVAASVAEALSQLPAGDSAPVAENAASDTKADPSATVTAQTTAPDVSAPAAADTGVAPVERTRRAGSRRATQSTQETESLLPPIEILDIPIAKAPVQRRISTHDAEVLLDSVLDALPEPKQPGQGRSKSRRVSTAALSAPHPE